MFVSVRRWQRRRGAGRVERGEWSAIGSNCAIVTHTLFVIVIRKNCAGRVTYRCYSLRLKRYYIGLELWLGTQMLKIVPFNTANREYEAGYEARNEP